MYLRNRQHRPGVGFDPGLFLLPLRQCANLTAAAGVRRARPVLGRFGAVVVANSGFQEKSDMTQWYETLFANFGKTYDKESFTQGTVGEVDFVERELGADRSKRILDIGCGTGRHAIELARRGYRVTGFDLSEGQLRLAREKAAAAGVTVEFQRRDATQPHFNAGIRRRHHVLRRRVSVDGDRREELRHSHARLLRRCGPAANCS